MKKIKAVYVLFLTFGFLLNTSTAEETASELSVEELKAVAQSMRAVEDALLNVRIDSNAWVEEGPSLSGPWERTPVCLSSTAYFGKISSNRARLDIHKIVGEWKNGAAPYLEKNYSVSFDGQYGRYINNSNSYNGKVFYINKYRILSEAPFDLKTYWHDKMTGVRASLFFHYRDMPEPLSKRFSVNFEAAADPNYLDRKPIKPKVVLEELGGIQCIKVAYMGGDSFRQEWWLDPNRGFALLRHDNMGEDRDGNEQVKSSINVTKLKEVAENIWWPMEAYFVSCPHEADKPWKRIVYRASNVVANEPDFDDSIFTVPIPEGYSVDEVEYETIYTGGVAEQEKK